MFLNSASVRWSNLDARDYFCNLFCPDSALSPKESSDFTPAKHTPGSEEKKASGYKSFLVVCLQGS